MAGLKQGQHLVRFGLSKELRRGPWRNRRRVGAGAEGLQVPMGQGHPAGLGIATDKLPLHRLGPPKFFLWLCFLIGKVPRGVKGGEERPLWHSPEI